MEKEDRPLIISTILFVLLILVGVIQSFTGYAVSEGNVITGSVTIGEYITDSILPRFFEIISSPFTSSEMLWIAIPLIIVLLFMEIYFGRWRNEKLGWSSSFANWITLLFVGVNLFNQMLIRYSEAGTIPIEVVYKFLLIFLIFLMAISFMIVLFLHAIPKSASYIVSSPLTIYTFAFVMIALVYSDIPLDFSTLIAALLVYIVVLVIFKIIKSLVPPSQEAKKYLAEKEKEKKKEVAIKKMVNTRKVHDRERRFKRFFRQHSF